MSRSFQIYFNNATRTVCHFNGCVGEDILFSDVNQICKGLGMQLPLPHTPQDFETLNEYNCFENQFHSSLAYTNNEINTVITVI